MTIHRRRVWTWMMKNALAALHSHIYLRKIFSFHIKWNRTQQLTHSAWTWKEKRKERERKISLSLPKIKITHSIETSYLSPLKKLSHGLGIYGLNEPLFNQNVKKNKFKKFLFDGMRMEMDKIQKGYFYFYWLPIN